MVDTYDLTDVPQISILFSNLDLLPSLPSTCTVFYYIETGTQSQKEIVKKRFQEKQEKMEALKKKVEKRAAAVDLFWRAVVRERSMKVAKEDEEDLPHPERHGGAAGRTDVHEGLQLEGLHCLEGPSDRCSAPCQQGS